MRVILARRLPRLVDALAFRGALAASVAALLLTIGGGVVFAAQDAIPGDTLYPIKTGVENVQVALAPDGAAKAEMYLGIAQRRLTEIHLAGERGQPAAAATAAAALASSVEQAEQHRRASTDQP